ncbi:hypothetical protein SK128_028007 [Halocaridina rubra]|uniref:protein-tyrosine-phosphatase n=1 Tax=Halocaridina rubra TaxID=373956 RepID=A0AAN8X1H1_HALRR
MKQQDHSILYELNVSVSCPKPDFVQDSHFMRIPVNDNFSEKLLPYFNDAFHFIDKVRESGGCVLVHCLAGISRSATVAIAYVMKHLRLPFEEAYMYVKTRRPTISPNINFVGQLAELDRQLRRDATPRDPTSAPILFRTHESHLSSATSSSNSISSSSSAFTSAVLDRHACEALQGIPKSLSLNLKTTLEAVPASPSSTPHSPDMSPSTALARLSFASALEDLHDYGLPSTPKCPSPVTPLSCLPPSPPTAAAVIRDTTNSPVFSFKRYGSSSSPSSPAFASFFKSREVSSRTSSDYRRESFTSSDSVKSTSASSNSYYSSTTFNVGATDSERLAKEEKLRESNTSPLLSSASRQGKEREGRQYSVCVIDVKREASPVSYSRSEPLVVRETQVIATPCHTVPEVKSVLEVQVEDGRQKEEYIVIPEDARKNDLKTAIGNSWKQLEKSQSVRESISKSETCRQPGDTLSRPREVIVPIQVAGSHEGRPKVLELSVPFPQIHQKLHRQHPIPGAAACPTSNMPASGVWLPGSPREASVAELGAVTPNSASSSGVQQSDSGIIIEEQSREPPPSPQRLPRCYSSSETHLNTRRLLEHRNLDFTARKCSSYDEVGRAWPQTITANAQQNQANVSREGTTWLCPWDLARSDSVSTSGFGSEISDTDLLHDDAQSTTTQDDALGPYDAVFADVFPGDQSTQRQQQPTTPKTPRPASLPGVTGTYFSHFDRSVDHNVDMGVEVDSSVELRRGNRGRMGVEKKDSGYYSFLTEHPPVSPRTMGEGVRHTTNVPWPKERPKDLQLQITTVAMSPTNEVSKTTNCHTSVHASTTDSCKISPEKRMTPEKRKSRGSSTEENEEKRRSCEVDSHEWTPPRQALNIGSGVRMAHEWCGVEQLLSSEMRELKQRTSTVSSRLRLLGRSDTPESPSSPSSIGSSSGMSSCGSKSPRVHTAHIMLALDDESSTVKSMREKGNIPHPLHDSTSGCLGVARARSEPPFPIEEGLYRVRSCPGLPRSAGSTEGKETVSALVSDLQLVRLRGSHPQKNREKILNRYSCGALDARQIKYASSFESCPDFGNLRSCVREGDSIHSSSSSLSSSHSFTRLLQVS